MHPLRKFVKGKPLEVKLGPSLTDRQTGTEWGCGNQFLLLTLQVDGKPHDIADDAAHIRVIVANEVEDKDGCPHNQGLIDDLNMPLGVTMTVRDVPPGKYFFAIDESAVPDGPNVQIVLWAS